jgi:hypothetical protein
MMRKLDSTKTCSALAIIVCCFSAYSAAATTISTPPLTSQANAAYYCEVTNNGPAANFAISMTRSANFLSPDPDAHYYGVMVDDPPITRTVNIPSKKAALLIEQTSQYFSARCDVSFPTSPAFVRVSFCVIQEDGLRGCVMGY